MSSWSARRIICVAALLASATMFAQTATPQSKATAPQKTPVPPVKPVPPVAVTAAKIGMAVTLQAGAKSQPIAPLLARVVRIADRVDSARAAAIAMPVGKGGAAPATGNAVITYVWVLDQLPGTRPVSAPTPTFVVRYRDAPGVSPEDVAPAIVQVIGSAAGPRVIGALRGRADQASRAQADWDLDRDLKHEVIVSTVELSSRGLAKIAPAAPLPPGDYAVVMRPTGNKKFAGKSVLSEAEEGRVFGIVWTFVVK